MRSASRIATLAAGLCLFSAQAAAITITPLDATGAPSGPALSTTWTLYGGTPVGGASATNLGGGTDWEVLVGLPNFGSAENGSQPRGIYGAGTTVTGALGYNVTFSFDGYTWDSYNNTVPTNPGASRGYWDAFVVNINGTNPYWNLVNGGTGAQADPVCSPDPAGTPVVSGAPLPGTTWCWGGLDYAAGFFEEEHGTFSITLLGADPAATYFVSAVLDTNTTAQSDINYPSWGCFNLGPNTDCTKPTGGGSQDVPEPTSLALLGLGMVALAAMRRRRIPSR